MLPSYRNLSKQAISHRVTMKTCRVYNLTFELAIHDLYIVTSILELIIKSSNIFYVRLFQISSTSMISKNFIIRRIRKKIVEISILFLFDIRRIFYSIKIQTRGLKGLHQVKDSVFRISVSTFDVGVEDGTMMNTWKIHETNEQYAYFSLTDL